MEQSVPSRWLNRCFAKSAVFGYQPAFALSLLAGLILGIAIAEPAAAKPRRSRDWPLWEYVVSHQGRRVDMSFPWPKPPALGKIGDDDAPIWHGRLLLLFRASQQLPELTADVSFMDRAPVQDSLAPSVAELTEELNDGASRAAAARGEVAVGRFSGADVSVREISGRRWYLWRSGWCNLRYLTVIDEEALMQVSIACDGGHWVGLKSREQRWQPWVDAVLGSVRVADGRQS